MNELWPRWIQRMNDIIRKGKTDKKDKDYEKLFNDLQILSDEITEKYTSAGPPNRDENFYKEFDYPTPAVDVRAVIFKENKILLRQEKDGKWSLPGGWAEIGQSPEENIIREVKEETGIQCEVEKLLKISDRNIEHPPYAAHVYKIYYLCKILNDDNLKCCKYFAKEELPLRSEISERRTNFDCLITLLNKYSITT
jgi:ADP-ribose pyrophosphatase YjhB (NUDIX family)